MEQEDNAPRSWGQRNALTIMLVVMGLMFVLVIVVQMLS